MESAGIAANLARGSEVARKNVANLERVRREQQSNQERADELQRHGTDLWTVQDARDSKVFEANVSGFIRGKSGNPHRQGGVMRLTIHSKYPVYFGLATVLNDQIEPHQQMEIEVRRYVSPNDTRSTQAPVTVKNVRHIEVCTRSSIGGGLPPLRADERAEG